MKAPTRKLLIWISLILITALFYGCGGGSASGGIGGSGFQAQSIGSVSAVGSITVNGVRYETTSADIRDDNGTVLSESDLSEGLVVEVSGEINNDGINGTATQVTLITAVQGPVDQPPTANSITVMGQPVALDDQTMIDDSITAGGGITNLNSGDLLEVHGIVDPNGTIRATRVELKLVVNIFKVRGFVASTPTATTFTINGLTVDFSTATQNDFGAAGPALGDFVSVKGNSLNTGTLTLTAASLEDGDRRFGDTENAEIEGFITTIGGSTFTLASGAGTFQFRTDAATEFEGGGLNDLAIGLKVEVEGLFSGGVLIADKVEVKDGIRLETNVDITTRNISDLTIRPVNISALVLKLNDQTEIDENRTGFPDNPTAAALLASLDGSETLRLRARVSSAAVPNATELVVTDLRVFEDAPAVIELRGPLDAPPALNGDLQILGVNIASSEATTTFFAIDDTTELNRSAFLNQITTGTLVEAEGAMATDNEMDATQLAIED